MAEKEYTIHLNNIVRIPRTRYANKAIYAIRDFVKKHTHAKHENIRLSNDVNHAVWERGMNYKVNKVQVVLRKKDDLVYVFTPAGSDLKTFEKAATESKKKETKEKKGEAKTEKKETPPVKEEKSAKAEKKDKEQASPAANTS